MMPPVPLKPPTPPLSTELPLLPPSHEGECVVCHGILKVEEIAEHQECARVSKLALEFLAKYEGSPPFFSNYCVELVVRDRQLVFIGPGAPKVTKMRLLKAAKRVRHTTPKREKKGRKH